MLTFYLSCVDVVQYRIDPDAVRAIARRFARARGRRFAELVGLDGGVLEVVEARG